MGEEAVVSHQKLVKKAAKWLRRKHSVVITEMVTFAGETPDAIGFNHHLSTLIECKTSRQDFKKDAKKYFRRMPDKGMGTYRYYLSPKDLLKQEELPDNWGLLEEHPRGLSLVRESGVFEKNRAYENTLLVSVIRRIGQMCPKGVSVKCYTFATGNTATLGIEKDE